MTISKTLLNPAGGPDNYVLMSTAESANQQVLSEPFELVCYAGEIEDTCEWLGWTTDATNFITIKANPGDEHKGVIGDGFIMNNTNSGIADTLVNSQNNTVIQDISVHNTGFSTNNIAIKCDGSGIVQRCIAISSPAGFGTHQGIQLNNSDLQVRNCLAVDTEQLTAGNYRGFNSNNNSSSILNCTAIGFENNIYVVASSVSRVFTNIVAQGSSFIDFGGNAITSTASYLASGDATATAPNSFTGVVEGDFENYALQNFAPKAGGQLDPVNNPGFDNTAEGYTDDITGAERVGTWTIGAYSVAGGAPVDSNLLQGGDFTTLAGVTPPTGVDAGGPYTGTVSTPIQLAGTFTPGSDLTPVLTWTIEAGSAGSGTFTPNANAEDPTFTPDTVGNYNLKFSVDPDDGAPVEDTATLDSQAAATAPTNADAGGPYTGTVNTAISVAATYDAGTGANLVLLWTADKAGSFANSAAASTTFTPTTIDAAYTLTFRATNDEGFSEDTANLDSQAGATAPTDVNAHGPYQGVVDTAIDVMGTYTPGSDPTPVLAWTADKPGSFANPAAAITTFTPTTIDPVYTLTFTVDADDAAPVFDTTTLQSNAIPVGLGGVFVGSTPVEDFYVGETLVNAVYAGTVPVWKRTVELIGSTNIIVDSATTQDVTIDLSLIAGWAAGDLLVISSTSLNQTTPDFIITPPMSQDIRQGYGNDSYLVQNSVILQSGDTEVVLGTLAAGWTYQIHIATVFRTSPSPMAEVGSWFGASGDANPPQLFPSIELQDIVVATGAREAAGIQTSSAGYTPIAELGSSQTALTICYKGNIEASTENPGVMSASGSAPWGASTIVLQV